MKEGIGFSHGVQQQMESGTLSQSHTLETEIKLASLGVGGGEAQRTSSLFGSRLSFLGTSAAQNVCGKFRAKIR